MYFFSLGGMGMMNPAMSGMGLGMHHMMNPAMHMGGMHVYLHFF